jgi:putative addiction module component (TIGR02574 family)
MKTANSIEEARTLSIHQRLEFLFSAWDQLIDANCQPTLSPDMKAELDQRRSSYLVNPTEVFTWEEIQAEMKKLL